MFVRLLARPLLAAKFIAENVRGVQDPQSAVGSLERVVSIAYVRVTGQQPSETVMLNITRATSAAGVVGGGMLALGILPRAGAVIVAGVAISRLVASTDLADKTMAERGDALLERLGDASAIGGVLLAAVDTAGKPSLANRARQAGKEAKLHAAIAKRDAALQTAQAKRQARELGRRAQRDARSLARSLRSNASHAAGSAYSSARTAVHNLTGAIA
ncbi:hypothetical protein JT358_14830 [Micrococcales bacterium 31B]|nr:hypothetical protein [Micrococcales bacterium 31B]